MVIVTYFIIRIPILNAKFLRTPGARFGVLGRGLAVTWSWGYTEILSFFEKSGQPLGHFYTEILSFFEKSGQPLGQFDTEILSFSEKSGHLESEF